MGERCPCCGRAVRVVTGDEGTSHYELVADPELTRLREGNHPDDYDPHSSLIKARAELTRLREGLEHIAAGGFVHARDPVNYARNLLDGDA
jgi:hypothetical protein